MYRHTYSKSMDQSGKVFNPARGQLNRENEYFRVRVRAWGFGLARRVRHSRMYIEERLNERPRLHKLHDIRLEDRSSRHMLLINYGERTSTEPACFGLSSPWSSPSRSDILLHAVVQPWLSLQDPYRHETLRPLFRRPAPFPRVLGYSHPLVGIDAKVSEVVQEKPHSLFPWPPTRPAPPTISPNIHTLAVSYTPCAPQTSQTRSASCVKSPRCSHFPS